MQSGTCAQLGRTPVQACKQAHAGRGSRKGAALGPVCPSHNNPTPAKRPASLTAYCWCAASPCQDSGCAAARRACTHEAHKRRLGQTGWSLVSGLLLQPVSRLHHSTSFARLRAWYCSVCRNCGSSGLGAGGLLRLATSSASLTCRRASAQGSLPALLPCPPQCWLPSPAPTIGCTSTRHSRTQPKRLHLPPNQHPHTSSRKR